MRYDYIKQGDCLELIKELNDNSVNLVLTSPPYNISRGVNTTEEILKHKSKYGEYKDNLPNDEYRNFMVNVMNELDRVLVSNGVILLNLSYASSVEVDSRASDLIKLLFEIINRTKFDIADIITWKKKSALPCNRSSNKLTRICEYIFVLCRKDEYTTYCANKPLTSYNKEKNLKFYGDIRNFIEAKNNDGSNPYNKATFSTELVEKLLNIYSTTNNDIVLDPFMGTGTTAIGCINCDRHYIGFELSNIQVEYSLQRIEMIRPKFDDLD